MGHAVILSIVGADLVPRSVYDRAKVLQEDILKAGPVPYSIVRATQFFEFIDAVLSWTADENSVRLPTTLIQPIAAAEVAAQGHHRQQRRHARHRPGRRPHRQGRRRHCQTACRDWLAR